LLTSKNRDDTSSDMHVCIPFTNIVQTLQKACQQQLESDKKASMTEKPQAKRKRQISDQVAGLGEELRKKEQELRKKEQELRKKEQELHEQLRKKDGELRKKDEELRSKDRELRLAKRHSS